VPYTKKTWSPGDRILDADMNNMEGGLDDIFNQAITFTGVKKFTDPAFLGNAQTLGKGARLSRSGFPTHTKDILTGAGMSFLFSEDSEFGFRFESPLGTLGNMSCGPINDVLLQLHAARHMTGGADEIAKMADIVVDLNGKGDYETLADAASAGSVNDVIYMREGSYIEDESITLKEAMTLIGSGYATTIGFSSPSYALQSTSNYVRLLDFRYKNASLPITLTGDYCLIDRCTIHQADGVQIEGEYNRVGSLFVDGTVDNVLSVKGNFNTIKNLIAFGGGPTIIEGNYNKISGFQLWGTDIHKGISVLGDYNAIHNGIIADMVDGIVVETGALNNDVYVVILIDAPYTDNGTGTDDDDIISI